MREPLIFTPPPDLCTFPHELWIACGEGADWCGAHIDYSEDDDDYISVGRAGPGVVWGELMDPLPLFGAGRLHLRVFDKMALPSRSLEEAGAGRSTLYLTTGECIGFTRTTLLTTLAGNHIYLADGTILRGIYGQMQRAAAGTRFVWLTHRIFRLPLPPRLVGRPLYFRVVPADPMAECGDEEAPVTPILYRGDT